MAGEKPTSKPLQLEWQGSSRPTDGFEIPDQRRVAVIGVGRTGNNIVTCLTKIGTANALKIAINVNPLFLGRSQADEKILIGSKAARRPRTDGITVCRHAQELQHYFEKFLAGIEAAFVVTDSQARIGAEPAHVAVEIANKKGVPTIGVVMKPFKKERKKAPPHSALKKFQRECNTVIIVDCAKLMELRPQLPTSEIAKITDQASAKMIQGLIKAISASNLANLGFNDSEASMKRGRIAAVGIGEADSTHRVEEAVRSALRSHMRKISGPSATGAVIYDAGDSQRTIDVVARVGEINAEMMHSAAKVIWGLSVDPELEGKLEVTLLMAGVDRPSLSGSLKSIAPQLFNLELHSKPDKKLPIDLGLYQLEDF